MLEVIIKKKLNNFDLDMDFKAEKEIFALLGASGCGKSVTLRCIAGIEQPDAGRIVLDGRVLYDSVKKINLPPQERHVGYMFQDYALFPNMTVRENVMAGMPARRQPSPDRYHRESVRTDGPDQKHPSSDRHIYESLSADTSDWKSQSPDRRLSKKELRQLLTTRADEILRTFHIEDLADEYPAKLSGGQKQRVAMARIVAQEPDAILLDEPFSALDSYLKWQLEQEMKRILTSLGKPTIFVTHNRDEVYHLAETVGAMKSGRIETVSEMKTFFEHPETRTAAILSGCKNISDLHIDEQKGTAVCTDWGLVLPLSAVSEIGKSGDGIACVGIRAHYFSDVRRSPDDIEISVAESFAQEDPFEWTIFFRVSPGKEAIQWKVAKSDMPSLHLPEKLYLNPADIMLLID